MKIIDRLTGHFLTIKKLAILLAANDITIESLVDGAKARLFELEEDRNKNEKDAIYHEEQATNYRNLANIAAETMDQIESALAVFVTSDDEPKVVADD